MFVDVLDYQLAIYEKGLAIKDKKQEVIEAALQDLQEGKKTAVAGENISPDDVFEVMDEYRVLAVTKHVFNGDFDNALDVVSDHFAEVASNLINEKLDA